MTTLRYTLLVGVCAAILPTSAQSALIVTNGTFGTANQNARIVDGGGWFESNTADNWVEGSWGNAGSYPDTFPDGSGMACLFDGASTNGYIYQSLGTIDQISLNGALNIFADFAEKDDNITVDCVFTLYAGTFNGLNGTDIAGGGLTEIFTRTLTAAEQGLTALGGDNSRAIGVAVNTAPISLNGLAEGTEIWLRIGRPSGGTGDVIIDNVSVDVIPEPTAALLGTIGLLGLLGHRRRA